MCRQYLGSPGQACRKVRSASAHCRLRKFAGQANAHRLVANRSHVGLSGLLPQHFIGQDDEGLTAALKVRGHALQLVPDVSVNRALVEELAIRCTVNQLEPCHMEDVIEDALAF